LGKPGGSVTSSPLIRQVTFFHADFVQSSAKNGLGVAEYMAHSPECMDYSAEYMAYSPEYMDYSVEYMTYSPEYMGYLAEYMAYLPEYMDYSPGHRAVPVSGTDAQTGFYQRVTTKPRKLI
jgi:hypothetical protein